MARISRKDILDRLRGMIARGEPIVGGGAGTGLSAKCEEAGGIDLIVIYNSGRYRMAGRGSLAGLLAYGNANDVVLEMAREVLPVVKSTPVLAGVNGTDPFLVLDDFLRRLGHKVHYGDASRLELLHAAGCERARLFILAIDDVDQSVAVAAMVRKHFPHLDILARARDRPHYYKLHKLGVKVVLRETFSSALELGTEALRNLGFRGHTAHRMARLWRQQDERALLELSKLWGGDQSIYFDAAKKAVAEAERLMKAEDPKRYRDLDDGWDNEDLRKDKRATGTGEADAAATTTPTPPDEPPPAPPV